MTETLGVMCSGRGTNLSSIISAVKSGKIPARIGVVVSDNPEAKALTRAREAGIPAILVNRGDFESRDDFEKELVSVLRDHGVTLVILAGFMRILSPYFVNEFPGRIMNIHPSLLPSFGGAHAHRDVLAYGAKVSGCTVHFVDEGMDSGPIILQAAVPVEEDDTEETLAARVLTHEHRIYPRAIELFLKGKLKFDGRRVIIAR